MKNTRYYLKRNAINLIESALGEKATNVAEALEEALTDFRGEIAGDFKMELIDLLEEWKKDLVNVNVFTSEIKRLEAEINKAEQVLGSEIRRVEQKMDFHFRILLVIMIVGFFLLNPALLHLIKTVLGIIT